MRRDFLSRAPAEAPRYQLRGIYFARFGVLLTAKAAEIVPCPNSDEETLIFSPLQDIACILSAKQAMEGAKSLPTGHTF